MYKMSSPDITKAFDPVLDEVDYIDMSGANSLKRASRNSAEMEFLRKKDNKKLTASTPEDKSSKINSHNSSPSEKDITKVNVTDDSLLMQMSLISPTKMDIESVNLDDTYVTICGSTYLSPHCESCLHEKEKECTYMSIDSVSSGNSPVIPPRLPKRNSVESSSSKTTTSSAKCMCKTARVQRLSPLRPRDDDVLIAGDHKYTVQQIVDSVDKLTSNLHEDVKTRKVGGLPSQDNCRDSGFFDYTKGNYFSNTSVNILDRAMCESTTDELPFGVNNIMRCKSKKPSTNMIRRPKTYPYARNESNHCTDTYDTFSSVTTTSYSHSCILEEYSYVTSPSTNDEVKLPLNSKKTNKAKRKRSFLDHFGSVSSMISSKSSRPRLYSASEYSINISKRSSPFKKNSLLRSSLKGLKNNHLIDNNNNRAALYGEAGSIHHGFVNPNSRETCC